jgi:hypothetical protein
MSPKIHRIAATKSLLPLALAIVLPLAACRKADKPSHGLYASPDMAGEALLEAGKSGDQSTLIAIFGPDSKELISSGDAVQDKAVVHRFVEAYGVMHRWRKLDDGAQVLLVGSDNYAFPVPLKKNGAGQWYFDVAAGKDEVLSRRVGRNELAVMEACNALADAQAEYFSLRHDDGSTHQYALKFISDTGTQNGLYWEPAGGQPMSPLGPLVAFATTEGYSKKPNSPVPFHGYYFHMLTSQGSHVPGGAKDYVVDGKMTGGFALVAYPVEYGNSGVMTFMISQSGLLLQKDLGKATTETAAAMSQFDPDDSWRSAQQ